MHKYWSCWFALFASISVGPSIKAETPLNLLYEMEIERPIPETPTPLHGFEQDWDKLLEDLAIYRYTVTDMNNEVAAQKWWELAQRGFHIAIQSNGQVKSSLEPIYVHGFPNPIPDITQALPPSRAWAAIENVLEKDTSADPVLRSLIRIQMAALRQDYPKCSTLVAEAREEFIKHYTPSCLDLDEVMEEFETMESRFLETFGSLEDRFKQFQKELDQAYEAYQKGEKVSSNLTWLPALSEIDEQRLRPWMKKYLSLGKPINGNDKAVELARKVLLESPELMSDHYWSLADPRECPELFERMTQELAVKTTDGSARALKELLYLNVLIDQQRYAEVQEKLDEWVAVNGVKRMEYLKFPVHTDSLQFLRTNLDRNPTLPWWDGYAALSRQLGKAQEAEDFFKHTLEKGGLAPRIKQPLQGAYIAHLVAMARYDIAVDEMRKISNGPASNMTMMMQFRLSKLGRLNGNKDLELEGLEPLIRSARRMPGQNIDVIIMALLRNGKAMEAEELLKHVLPIQQQKHQQTYGDGGISSNRPTFVSYLLCCLAKVYHDTERYDELLNLLRDSEYWDGLDVENVNESKNFPKSLKYMTGNALIKTGQIKHAVNLAERLIYVEPESDEGYSLLVQSLGAEALPKLDAYLADRPEEIRPLVWKAKILLQQNKAEDALKLMRQALEIEPCEIGFTADERRKDYEVLAEALKATVHADEAAKYDKLPLAMELCLQAEQWGTIKGYTESLKLYQKALELYEPAFELHLGVSSSAFELGQKELAEKHAKRALELLVKDISNNTKLGATHYYQLASPQFSTFADEYLTKLSESSPDDPKLTYLRAMIKSMKGDAKEALALYLKTIQLNPRMATAYQEALHLSGNDASPIKLAEELTIAQIRLEPLNNRINKSRILGVKNLAMAWDVTYELDKLAPASHRPPLMYPLRRKVEIDRDVEKTSSSMLYPLPEVQGKDVVILYTARFLRPVYELIHCREVQLVRQERAKRDRGETTPRKAPDLRNRS